LIYFPGIEYLIKIFTIYQHLFQSLLSVYLRRYSFIMCTGGN